MQTKMHLRPPFWHRQRIASRKSPPRIKSGFTSCIGPGQIVNSVVTATSAGRVIPPYFKFNSITTSFLQGCGFADVESLLVEHAEYMSRELTLMLRRMRRRRWSGLPLLLRVVLRMRNVGDQPGKKGGNNPSPRKGVHSFRCTRSM